MKRFLPASLVLICLVAVGACGGDGDDRAAPPTTTSPATNAPPSAEDQVGELVEDWYGVRVSAVLNEDYDRGQVDDYLTGNALEQFEASSAEREEMGIATRRPDDDPSRSEVISVEVTGDTATARECTVDPLVQYEETTGEIVNDEVLTAVRELSMTRKDDRWLIERVTLESEKEGVVPCPDA